MTDETTVTPPDEEPGGTASPEAPKPDRAGQPTSMILPTDNEATRTSAPPDEFATATDAQTDDEATQTSAPADEFATATDAQATQADATPVSPDEATSSSSTTPVSPEATPMQSYEHFGALQPPVYPGVVPTLPSDAAPGNPNALPYQGGYAPYPGQPGLPGQFYPGQPAAPVPPAKRRRTILWVAIVILALLLLGGTATLTYALTQPQAPSPNATLRAYCQAVKTGDAQGIYKLLSQQARVHTSLDDLQNTFDALNQLGSLGIKYSDCTFNNVRVSGSLAVATISLTISMSFENQTATIISPTLVSLVLENNQWKIDFSNFAQPQPKINLPGLLLTPTPNI